MIETERDAPDLEDLAAYCEGRLSGERKARVEERLLRDEDYYEVFLENVRFAEEEARGGAAVARPGAWWRSWRVAVPVAVAAGLALVVGLPKLLLPSTDEWVARLDAKKVLAQTVTDLEWDDPDWYRMRGPSSPYRPEELAFRLGARIVDLRIALAAGDPVEAGGPAADLRRLTGYDVGLLPLEGAYESLLEKLANDDVEIGKVAAEAASLEAILREHYEDAQTDQERAEAERFALGVWTEAGRLAALAEDAQALAGVYRKRRPARSVEAVRPHLDELSAIVARPDLAREDFEAAAQVFSEIGKALAG